MASVPQRLRVNCLSAEESPILQVLLPTLGTRHLFIKIRSLKGAEQKKKDAALREMGGGGTVARRQSKIVTLKEKYRADPTQVRLAGFKQSGIC